MALTPDLKACPGGPLAEGLIVGDTVRCPWHHACFSLRTCEAVAAPAFNPMPCWRVEKRNGTVFVREKIEPADQRRPGKAPSPSAKPERVVIMGGGAAGFAAAEMLRREASFRDRRTGKKKPRRRGLLTRLPGFNPGRPDCVASTICVSSASTAAHRFPVLDRLVSVRHRPAGAR
jgi:Rieske [2Fe-2S] domain